MILLREDDYEAALKFLREMKDTPAELLPTDDFYARCETMLQRLEMARAGYVRGVPYQPAAAAPLPSAADLDRVADEERARLATANPEDVLPGEYRSS